MVAIAGAGALNTDRWAQLSSNRTAAPFDGMQLPGLVTDAPIAPASANASADNAAAAAYAPSPSAFFVPANTFEFAQSRSSTASDQSSSSAAAGANSDSVNIDSDDQQTLGEAMRTAVASVADEGADPVAVSVQMSTSPDSVTLTSVALGIIPINNEPDMHAYAVDSKAAPSIAVDVSQ